MKYFLVGINIWLVCLSHLYAQTRPTPAGDCTGTMNPIFQENPEVQVGPIGPNSIGQYAGGQVLPSPDPLIRNVAYRKCKGGGYVIDVTLKMVLTTQIVGWFQNPVTRQQRTQEGMDKSRSHEAVHREQFRIAHSDYVGRFTPLVANKWDSYAAAFADVNPVRLQMEADWAIVINHEANHIGSHWTTWYGSNGYGYW